ncbi:MAG: hypothetical protein LCI00_23045 [Chloroflexi bacterium]|nr:hypothetical protein [Chloroflexota bacterium]MCC6895931.1 hypothetical protein [Anaerolineae bacterium]
MGYLIQWDNTDKTVVLQQYTGEAGKEDLYHLAEESANMLNGVSHTVHLIIDERTIKLSLSSVDMKYLEMHVPPNQGAVVMLVEKNSLPYKQWIQTLGKSRAPKAFDKPFFAATLEEARELLHQLFGVRYP